MTDLTEQDRRDAEAIWDYHRMGHAPRRCSVAIGLGSHDLGVARFAAQLHHDGLFPLVVFTGATSPTTAARFPRGEAVHYREEAVARGVPPDAVLVEPEATNTGQNITRSRALLDGLGVTVDSVLLVSKPYMERRAFATCRQVWPEVEVVCQSEPLGLQEYVRSVGDERLVVDMLVGDLQRLVEYPKRGFAVAQDIPTAILDAYGRLVRAGFDRRLL